MVGAVGAVAAVAGEAAPADSSGPSGPSGAADASLSHSWKRTDAPEAEGGRGLGPERLVASEPDSLDAEHREWLDALLAMSSAGRAATRSARAAATHCAMTDRPWRTKGTAPAAAGRAAGHDSAASGEAGVLALTVRAPLVAFFVEPGRRRPLPRLLVRAERFTASPDRPSIRSILPRAALSAFFFSGRNSWSCRQSYV